MAFRHARRSYSSAIPLRLPRPNLRRDPIWKDCSAIYPLWRGAMRGKGTAVNLIDGSVLSDGGTEPLRVTTPWGPLYDNDGTLARKLERTTPVMNLGSGGFTLLAAGIFDHDFVEGVVSQRIGSDPFSQASIFLNTSYLSGTLSKFEGQVAFFLNGPSAAFSGCNAAGVLTVTPTPMVLAGRRDAAGLPTLWVDGIDRTSAAHAGATADINDANQHFAIGGSADSTGFSLNEGPTSVVIAWNRPLSDRELLRVGRWPSLLRLLYAEALVYSVAVAGGTVGHGLTAGLKLDRPRLAA